MYILTLGGGAPGIRVTDSVSGTTYNLSTFYSYTGGYGTPDAGAILYNSNNVNFSLSCTIPSEHRFLGWFTIPADKNGGNLPTASEASVQIASELELTIPYVRIHNRAKSFIEGGTAYRICYPKIKPIIRYTVTYNANGGSVSPTSETVEDGDTVTLPTPTPPADATFLGWYDGSTRVGGAEDTYTPTADVTLVAKWDRIVIGETELRLPSASRTLVGSYWLTRNDATGANVLRWNCLRNVSDAAYGKGALTFLRFTFVFNKYTVEGGYVDMLHPDMMNPYDTTSTDVSGTYEIKDGNDYIDRAVRVPGYYRPSDEGKRVYAPVSVAATYWFRLSDDLVCNSDGRLAYNASGSLICEPVRHAKAEDMF